MKQLTIIIFSFVFLISCGQAKTDTSENSIASTIDTTSSVVSNLKLNPGDFIAKINCPGSNSQSFALYVPHSYTADKKIPVLFLFDPHGDGSLPLKLYRNLADKYGYFLIGSNDSKNGNPKELTASILQNIFQSGFQLLPIDNQRVYAGGFSGGGRIAAMLAFSPAKVQGLVTCGAGFPSDAWKGTPPGIVVGIAGNADMNLDELVRLKISDPALASRFQLIRFEGKHEWPAEEVFEQAFLAFESNALRDKIIPRNEEAIKQIDDTYRKDADNLAAKGLTFLTAGIYGRWIQSLDGMIDLKVTKNSYKDLIRKPVYLQVKRTDESLFAEEEKRKQIYVQAFGKNDTIWWQQQMTALLKEMKASDPLKKDMLSRLTGSLSLICYMNLNQALNSNPDAALYISTLYKTIDPGNSEAWYLAAVVSAKHGKYPTAITYLDKAVETGFNDRARISSEASFAELNNDPAFAQVINKISR